MRLRIYTSTNSTRCIPAVTICELINNEIIDLKCIPIQGKFVFSSNGDKCFSVGEFTQARAYQLLTNIASSTGTDKIAQKKCFKLNYFELRVSSDREFLEGIYDLFCNTNI